MLIVTIGDSGLDVRAGTCSFSVYSRSKDSSQSYAPPPVTSETPIPNVNWRGNGIFGKWSIDVNGNCSFLKNGEERNWGFVGEEAWDFPVTKDEDKVVERPLVAPEKGKI